MVAIKLLDVVGAFSAFLATIAYVRVSLWAFVLGAGAILVDILLYYQSGIYGDMTLQLIYLILTFYGWYQWKYGGSKRQGVKVINISAKQCLWLTMIALVGISVVFYLLSKHTDSQIPFLDAATTVLSLMAQWMLSRKIIENWWLWLVIDVMYFGIYFYKGISAHAALQLIYLGMAVAGYWYWRKQLNSSNPSSFALSSVSKESL